MTAIISPETAERWQSLCDTDPAAAFVSLCFFFGFTALCILSVLR